MRRKHLGGSNFFACDWTGIPLKNNKFHLLLKRGEKWVKHGHYLSWQCAAAHAYLLSKTKQIGNLDETLMKLNEVAGFEVQAAPDFSELMHFGGQTSVHQYKKACMQRSDPITAMLISESGEIQEIVLTPTDGSYDDSIKQAIKSQRFDEIPLAKSKLGKDVHVVVLANLQSSAGANTSIPEVKGLGVSLAGNVLVTCSRGPKACKMYANFDRAAFEAIVAIKRKAVSAAAVAAAAPPPAAESGKSKAAAMSKTEFDVVAAEMKRGLDEINAGLQDNTAQAPKKRAKKTAAKKQ